MSGSGNAGVQRSRILNHGSQSFSDNSKEKIVFDNIVPHFV